MGIVYRGKVERGYISSPSWRPTITPQRAVKVLTRQSIQFLEHVGLRIRDPGGG